VHCCTRSFAPADHHLLRSSAYLHNQSVIELVQSPLEFSKDRTATLQKYRVTGASIPPALSTAVSLSSCAPNIGRAIELGALPRNRPCARQSSLVKKFCIVRNQSVIELVQSSLKFSKDRTATLQEYRVTAASIRPALSSAWKLTSSYTRAVGRVICPSRKGFRARRPSPKREIMIATVGFMMVCEG
jgi:hypothetical protein